MAKLIVITGATSGIGEALVKRFLERKETVFAIGRNPAKLEALKTHASSGGQLQTFQANFAKLKDIDDVAKALLKAAPNGIDVLIHNAAVVPSSKRFSEDNIELQLQVNHLAVVKLTHLLYPALVANHATVITTSSDAHKGGRFKEKDIVPNPRYGIFRTYAKTKLYNLMFSAYLKAHDGDKLHVFAVHPGVVKTDLGVKGNSRFMQKVWRFFTKRAATPDTVPPTYEMLVDQAPDLENLYYAHQKPLNHLSVVSDASKQQALMEASLKLLNLSSFGHQNDQT